MKHRVTIIAIGALVAVGAAAYYARDRLAPGPARWRGSRPMRRHARQGGRQGRAGQGRPGRTDAGGSREPCAHGGQGRPAGRRLVALERERDPASGSVRPHRCDRLQGRPDRAQGPAAGRARRDPQRGRGRADEGGVRPCAVEPQAQRGPRQPPVHQFECAGDRRIERAGGRGQAEAGAGTAFEDAHRCAVRRIGRHPQCQPRRLRQGRHRPRERRGSSAS